MQMPVCQGQCVSSSGWEEIYLSLVNSNMKQPINTSRFVISVSAAYLFLQITVTYSISVPLSFTPLPLHFLLHPFPLSAPPLCALLHKNRVVLNGFLQVEPKCRSCQERSSKRSSVTLHCSDMTTRQYAYKQITSCECRACTILRWGVLTPQTKDYIFIINNCVYAFSRWTNQELLLSNLKDYEIKNFSIELYSWFIAITGSVFYQI